VIVNAVRVMEIATGQRDEADIGKARHENDQDIGLGSAPFGRASGERLKCLLERAGGLR
jgi:hypothetical protein